MTQTRRAGGLTPAGKISAPAAGPDHLPRPRCSGALEDAIRDRRLVLVAAPAGYGKTSLLAEWAAGTTLPIAWLSLDPLDDSPARLVRVLTDAVLAALPELPGEAVPVPAPGGVGLQVDALIALLDGAQEPPVIVLDDVHHISAGTGRLVLSPLLQYARTRFVLAGRHDASIPVQRWRVAGELAEIRMGTLAFTQDEVHHLGRALGSPRHPDGSHALWELTGGWPVAVRLALAAGVPDQDDRLHRIRDRDIPLTDYLVEQVVDQLPADLAQFFLTASFAPALDTTMAEALLPGGAGMLETCYRRGLFLAATARDDGPFAYRWHSLVAAHARAVLTRRDPLAAQAAHRVIAEHLARSDPAGAIQHALDARSPALAAAVLGEHWPDLVVRGEADLIRRLRSALPAPFRDSPDVLIALSAADAIGGEPVHDPSSPEGRRAATVVGLVQTFLARCRPAPEEAIERGTALLDTPDLDDGTLALGLYLLARAELQRPLIGPEAVQRISRAAELAAARGWTALELACRAEQAVAAAQQGDYAEARRRGTAAIAEAEQHGWAATGIISGAHLAVGTADYWQDRLPDAAAELAAAIEAAGSLRPEVALHAAGVLAVVALCQGDPVQLDRAVAVLAAQGGDDTRPGHAAALRAVIEAFRLDSQRRTEEALTHAGPWLDRTDPTVRTWHSDLLRRTGDLPGAWRALQTARRAAEPWPEQVRRRVEVGAEAAEALLHRDPQAAHLALERALTAAADQDVIRPLRDRSAELRPLLSEHLAWGSAHEDLITRLLLADQTAPVARPSAWELTPRERDVLVCLRSSLTTEEIAGSMFLSINTIKTHMRAIYRKLGVAGRREAVRAGVERGLV